MVERKMILTDNVDAEYIYKNVQLCVANKDKDVPSEVGNIVSIPFLDLIIYLRVGIETDGEYGTFIINEDIINRLDLSIDNLYMNSFLNVEKAGYSIRKLSDVLDDVPDNLYIMTNSDGMFGAAGILLRTYLDAFADEIGAKKMAILPLNVHEVLIVPIGSTDCVKFLRSLVNDLNSGIVDDDLFLSNNVYIYNRYGKMEIFSE